MEAEAGYNVHGAILYSQLGVDETFHQITTGLVRTKIHLQRCRRTMKIKSIIREAPMRNSNVQELSFPLCLLQRDLPRDIPHPLQHAKQDHPILRRDLDDALATPKAVAHGGCPATPRVGLTTPVETSLCTCAFAVRATAYGGAGASCRRPPPAPILTATRVAQSRSSRRAHTDPGRRTQACAADVLTSG